MYINSQHYPLEALLTRISAPLLPPWKQIVVVEDTFCETRVRYCPCHTKFNQLSFKDVLGVDISNHYATTVDCLDIVDELCRGLRRHVDFSFLSSRKALEGRYIDVFFDKSINWTFPMTRRVAPVFTPVKFIFRAQLLEVFVF